VWLWSCKLAFVPGDVGRVLRVVENEIVPPTTA